MAHIPDGFLSAPVVAGTAAVAAAALAVAARRTRTALGEREAPLLGATTAFVFAAQMLNFPLGAGTSAHLLGGVLVAAVMGPWAAMLALFSVLLVQALLFQDGGIAALGANTLNVAVLSVGAGYGVYRWGVAILGGGLRGRTLAAGVAGYLSTVVVGAAVALELALSDTVPLRTAMVVVGGSHLVIGVGEAVITASIVAVLMRNRPGLLDRVVRTSAGSRRWALAGAVGSGVLAVAAAYVASAKPDALEWAAARLGLSPVEALHGPAAVSGIQAYGAGPWLPAMVGVAAVLFLGWGLARAMHRWGSRS